MPTSIEAETTGATGSGPLLCAEDPAPLLSHGPARRSPFLVLCDHAGNAIPRSLGSLGLSPEQRQAHIAWDIGGWQLAIALADALQAPLLGQAYSRLVIDCNRRGDARDSIAETSDGVTIPGNIGLPQRQREARWHEILVPYQTAIASALRDRPACLIAMHTCTPQMRGGTPRPWHVGVIANTDRRMQQGILRALEGSGMTLGDNEPYQINPLTDYTLPVHAEDAGLPYVEFEMRNDLFSTPSERIMIADRMARAIETAYATVGLEART